MHKCDRIAGTAYCMDGIFGDYLKAVSDQWLKAAPQGNPGMLEMFRDRDRRPLRDMVQWAGEFAGKYLTSAVQTLRLTGDPGLKGQIEMFVGELITLQADNGYLGPWPSEWAMTNLAPNFVHDTAEEDRKGEGTWDTWGHYHITLGLLMWHADTGDAAALACACRMGDLLCEVYLGDKSPRLVDTPYTEMNLAPAHSLALLHQVTGELRYRQLAEQIVEEFAAVDESGAYLTGNYLEGPLAGVEFFELPKPRWESLHPIMALSELYAVTGNERYRDAFERMWWSIVATDRHNTGGFSSGEQATGDPFVFFGIETCCTIAWIALGIEMLRMTGDSRVADELEFSTVNSVIGLHSVSGRWCTYDTPPDGKRFAFLRDNWHARPGCSELNCCAVNGPRGIGMVSDWALMRVEEDGGIAGLLLNWYGPSEMTARLDDAVEITLRQVTEYPFDGRVELAVVPSAPAAFCLKLRIPQWSTDTRVTVNGEAIANVEPGAYLSIDREWRTGDLVVIDFDMTLHFWVGENACAGRTSIYRGPILLAYDPRYNDIDGIDPPVLDARQLEFQAAQWEHWLPPGLLLEFTAANGQAVRLCDFGSAGEVGREYKSWLQLENLDDNHRCFYAPPLERRLRAEIGSYAALYELYPGRSLTGGNPKSRVMARLCREWPAFAQNCAAAREQIAADPDSEMSRSLADVLTRLAETSDILEPNLLERLEKEVAELALPSVSEVTGWWVSELQPPVPDICQAVLPDDSAITNPIQSHRLWFDASAVHRGRPGVLYLRVTVDMPEASDSGIRYGADGPVKVWVNSTEVDCRPGATTPARVDEYHAAATWRQGDNTIVFAVDSDDGEAWGVHVGAPRV